MWKKQRKIPDDSIVLETKARLIAETDSKNWKQVVLLTISTSKKTDTFKISGEKWRFTWSYVPQNEYDGVNITLYRTSSDVPVEFLLMQKYPSSPEVTYIYKGTGEYYFDVMGVNISKWTITVEEQ